jgi:hypothetical protein
MLTNSCPRSIALRKLLQVVPVVHVFTTAIDTILSCAALQLTSTWTAATGQSHQAGLFAFEKCFHVMQGTASLESDPLIISLFPIPPRQPFTLVAPFVPTKDMATLARCVCKAGFSVEADRKCVPCACLSVCQAFFDWFGCCMKTFPSRPHFLKVSSVCNTFSSSSFPFCV